MALVNPWVIWHEYKKRKPKFHTQNESNSFLHTEQVNGTITYCDFSAVDDIMLISYYIFIVQSVIGVVNNIMSFLVFVQRKYDNRPVYILVRGYYIFNLAFILIVAFVIIAVEPTAEDFMLELQIVPGIAFVCMMMADGMLVLLAMTQFLDEKFPIKMKDIAFVRKLTIPAIVIVVGISTLQVIVYIITHEPDYFYKISIYGLVTLIVLIVMNVATVIEKKRSPSQTSRMSSVFRNQLYRYINTSSGIFIITTLPYDIMVLSFPSPDDLDCSSIRALLIVTLSLAHVRFINYTMDNVAYLLISHYYKAEMKTILKSMTKSLRREHSTHCSTYATPRHSTATLENEMEHTTQVSIWRSKEASITNTPRQPNTTPVYIWRSNEASITNIPRQPFTTTEHGFETEL